MSMLDCAVCNLPFNTESIAVSECAFCEKTVTCSDECLEKHEEECGEHDDDELDDDDEEEED